MNSGHHPTVLSVTLSFFFSPWKSPLDTPTWTVMGNHICNVPYLKENSSDQPNSSLIIINIYNDMVCLHRHTRVRTWKPNLFSPSSFLSGFCTKIKNVIWASKKKTDGPADSEGEYSQVCLCRRSSHGIFIRQVVLSKSAYSSYKIMWNLFKINKPPSKRLPQSPE